IDGAVARQPVPDRLARRQQFEQLGIGGVPDDVGVRGVAAVELVERARWGECAELPERPDRIGEAEVADIPANVAQGARKLGDLSIEIGGEGDVVFEDEHAAPAPARRQRDGLAVGQRAACAAGPGPVPLPTPKKRGTAVA
ncbi:hypothetical protein RZS08_20060, partial [Arthrospira platensis SPKY1]|nr:hypothetical protein [Arthrospira platensis SPKY1]